MSKLKARRGVPGVVTGHQLVEDKVALRTREAEVIRLREGEGLTFEEIGKRLGVATTTVHDDYQRLSDRIMKESAALFLRWRGEHVCRVAELHQKLLREFEASKHAKVRRRMQRAIPTKKGDAKEEAPAITVTEVQQMDEQNEVGDPKFLEQAVKAASLLADLLGMTSRAARKDEEEQAPVMAPGMVSGPILEVSATVIPSDKKARAAIERFERSERQRVLKAAPERKEGTG